MIYPAFTFEGYRWRFGEVCAEFTTAGMQALSNNERPHPRSIAAWRFYNKAGIVQEIAKFKSRNLTGTAALFERVLAEWPATAPGKPINRSLFPILQRKRYSR